jgi:enterochelin esterase-like enzyme
MLAADVIPFIERTYRVKTDKWHRAMAGLSMGSMHTSMATMTHPELFGYIGLFSGFMRFIWKDEQPHLAALDDADRFAQDYRVFFRAMGEDDQFFKWFAEDDAILEEKGVNVTRRLYPGGHGWQVWRHCLQDFLPLIFKGEEA